MRHSVEHRRTFPILVWRLGGHWYREGVYSGVIGALDDRWPPRWWTERR